MNEKNEEKEKREEEIIKDRSKAYQKENLCLSHSWDLDDEICPSDNLIVDEYNGDDFIFDLDEINELNKKNIINFKWGC